MNISISDLPEIQHVQKEGLGTLDLAEIGQEQLQSILAAGIKHYGSLALVLGDVISKRWLKTSNNPYKDEIKEIAAGAGNPGVFLLNLSFEWTCTSSVASDPSGIGNRMLRSLDWPLEGLGRNVVVATMEGTAGKYENVTWPGFTGVILG